MAERTPEATEFLDGYLKQVRALARGAGEDGEEIASELREYIVEKTEQQAGTLVTLDVLRRSLAEVGTPEQVLDSDSQWKDRVSTTTNSSGASAASMPAAPVEPRSAPPSRSVFARSCGLGCGVMGAIGAGQVCVQPGKSTWSAVTKRSSGDTALANHGDKRSKRRLPAASVQMGIGAFDVVLL